LKWFVCVIGILLPVSFVFGELNFTNITDSAGVAGPHYGKKQYGGHGIQWADVTGDGKPDMYVTMVFRQKMPELFYRNIDGARFAEEAEKRGINSFDCGSHGGVWGDLDNDGDYDLLNGATGCDRNRVFENDGKGFFTDRTIGSGMLDVPLGTRGQVLFDFDLDGDLDIFCNNWSGEGEVNEFYRNEGNFKFTSINNGLAIASGVQGTTEGDFDNDGDLDILLCRGFGDDGPLILMRNTNGKFSRVPDPIFELTAPGQNGAVFCDVNNDGWLDIHPMCRKSKLFINNKKGTFTEKTIPSGPGFMAGFEDLDNDGDWDMVYAGDTKVYLNDGSGNFTASNTFDLGKSNDPRAVAFADIDNDGDMDFFYSRKRSYNRLIRNDLTDGGNWLKIRLTSKAGQAGAFGAKVKTYEPGHAGDPVHMIAFREARSQEGYMGQNDPVLHFGLGKRNKVDVQVTFLDGTVITKRIVSPNQTIDIDARKQVPSSSTKTAM